MDLGGEHVEITFRSILGCWPITEEVQSGYTGKVFFQVIKKWIHVSPYSRRVMFPTGRNSAKGNCVATANIQNACMKSYLLMGATKMNRLDFTPKLTLVVFRKVNMNYTL